MEKQDVPQDQGLAGDMREVTYAVNADGRYEAVPSCGWQPKTVALRQAWAVILEDLARIEARVRRGERSPLAWHMTRHQMGIGLLAKYAGVSRLRVYCHLRPWWFRRLDQPLLARYAEIFGIGLAELQTLPDSPGLAFDCEQEPHDPAF
jgi:hypothetical protein